MKNHSNDYYFIYSAIYGRIYTFSLNRWNGPNWLFDPHHCAKKGPVLCFCRTPPYFCSTCSCSNDPLIIVIRFSSWKFHRVTKLCRLIRPRKKSLNAKATLEIWWGLFSWLFKLGTLDILFGHLSSCLKDSAASVYGLGGLELDIFLPKSLD